MQPEQRAEDRVVAVLQRRFDGRARQAPSSASLVSRETMRAVARAAARSPQQRGGDRRDVLPRLSAPSANHSSATCERGRERPRQHAREPRGDGHRRSTAAPHAATPTMRPRRPVFSAALDARGEPAERDERMPAGAGSPISRSTKAAATASTATTGSDSISMTVLRP
jgi:hypothetical protein